MAGRVYHDFVIFTDPDDVVINSNGLLVSLSVLVFDSPVGQGDQKETVTLSEPLDLQNWAEPLRCREWDQDRAAQIRFGERLRDLILPPTAYRMFQRSLEWLRDEDGLRLRLRLAPELAGLPWEYLYDQPEGGERLYSSFLALNPRLSIVRHQAIPVRAEWFEPAGASPNQERRVVIAMASPPPYERYPRLDDLDVEQSELRARLDSAPGVDAVFVPDYETAAPGSSARLEDLRAALLRGAHIFHFTGHGDFSRDMGPQPGSVQGQGQIVLAGEDGQAALEDADRLCELLQSRGIRLVVLGACETAQRDLFQVWSSVAAALLKGRIAAVVAMQYTIKHQLGRAFAEAFYQALVERCTLDEAVTQGRLAMRDEALSLQWGDIRDWGAVTLNLRAAGGPVFEAVENEAIRALGAQRSEQRARLQVLWWEWERNGVLASRQQLAGLAKLASLPQVGAALLPYPNQALLLVRSALECGEWEIPWLEALRQDNGKWVRSLDGPGTRDEIRRLAGLEDEIQAQRPDAISPLAWAAVSAEPPAARRTAALALAAAGGFEALRQALQRLPVWRRGRRKAELFGVLADADPGLARQASGEPPWDRACIWWWRARRRMPEVQPLIWRGALGAGLGLGLMRSLMPYSLRGTPGYFLATNTFWGTLLGLGLAAGLLLAGPLLLQRVSQAGGARAWRPALLGLALGTLLFGLMHPAVCLLDGTSTAETAQLFLPGLAVGLGLALGQFGQPLARRPGIASVMLRLTAMLLPVLLAQAPAFRDPLWNAATMIYSPEKVGNSLRFSALLATWFGTVGWRLPALALLDAALAGVSMTLGMFAGFWRAQVWMKRQSRPPGANESDGRGGVR